VPRARLQALGIDVPVLPATSVGSLPKPPELVAARAAFRRGEIAREALDEAARAATAFWIAKQQELGLDILVDGQQDRGEMVAHFAGHLKGFTPGGLVRVRGNRYRRAPVISGEVRWTQPITVAGWSHAQGLAQKPVKGVLAGPYTLMDWSFNERYPSRAAACHAIARELHREAAALVKAGCRILQLDEPALGGRPDELGIAADAIRVVTRDLGAYVIVHACYGELEAVWPGLLALPADNLALEMTNRDFGPLGLVGKDGRGGAYPKDLSVGVLDVESAKPDTPEGILRRIRKALAVLKPEQVWVNPDCGLGGRTVDEAVARLAAMGTAAGKARGG
jgi:5-methyltetrahydropteroyltriglutamate--homocysteine methyltransferase